MNLEDTVRYLAHVGPVAVKRLEKLGIKTVRDLLFHLPFRYDDFSQTLAIANLKPSQTATICGQILSMKNVFTRTGKRMQRGLIADETGEIEVIWFNQVYLPKTLKAGMNVSLSGKVDWFGNKIALVSPEYEVISQNLKSPAFVPTCVGASRGKQNSRLRPDVRRGFGGQAKFETPNTKYQTPNTNLLHTGRLVPVYPETAGLSSKWLRGRIRNLLDQPLPLPDPLPPEVLTEHKLIPLQTALSQIHFPPTLQAAEEARRRLAFDELLRIQLAALERKSSWHTLQTAYPISVDQERILTFIAGLPFKLTAAQNRAAQEILDDLAKAHPMNRLLEGDVGSGKTVVAAIGAYSTYLGGLKTVVMAPTEILASQHAKTLETVLHPYGLKIGLLTGSNKPKIGDFDIFVGTHALLYQELPENVALVVIDEQHRFGVAQRSKLVAGRTAPHLLTMTATPIPRTVALTVFGDLDLSVLDELPEGRKRIKTYVVPPTKRLDAFGWLEKQILQNRSQAFIIYPIIEESQAETLKSVRAATAEFERLKAQIFPGLSLALLHGRMKSKEKEEKLREFREGKAQILVATPVVEVGIDIPNATIMIIEGAERFGLAQLHQLRGRVGRGQVESYCFLLTESDSEAIRKRLESLTTTYSGAALAELDLKLRGPGEIYGLKQHGFPDLKAASLTDHHLINETRETASSLLPRLSKLPLLRKSLESLKIEEVTPN